jgi:hypothetical protein
VRVGLAVEACVTVFVRVVPGVPVAAAEVEELEGALGAGAGGDIAVVVSGCAVGRGDGGTDMHARFPGTMRRSFPTRALPVARMRFSPAGVRGMSVVPVWRPSRDHSVSPWRTMKTRGSGIADVKTMVRAQRKIEC